MVDEIGHDEIACNLRWFGCLTPRAHDVPAAGCALFGVVLCRKGEARKQGRAVSGEGERLKGGLCGCFCGFGWVYVALVWQVRGRAAQGGRSTKEGVGGGRSKVGRRMEGARRIAGSGRHATT